MLFVWYTVCYSDVWLHQAELAVGLPVGYLSSIIITTVCHAASASNDFGTWLS